MEVFYLVFKSTYPSFSWLCHLAVWGWFFLLKLDVIKCVCVCFLLLCKHRHKLCSVKQQTFFSRGFCGSGIRERLGRVCPSRMQVAGGCASRGGSTREGFASKFPQAVGRNHFRAAVRFTAACFLNIQQGNERGLLTRLSDLIICVLVQWLEGSPRIHPTGEQSVGTRRPSGPPQRDLFAYGDCDGDLTSCYVWNNCTV